MAAGPRTGAGTSRAAISRVLPMTGWWSPCSIHDHAQAMDWPPANSKPADALQDDLLIVMRVF
jgi:3-deoxy-7-phosphoheptulonate synthase